MSQKISSRNKRILGIGCAVALLCIVLGAVIAPLTFVVYMVNDPAYQNGPPGKLGALVFGVIPFFLGGAVAGALIGVVVAVIIGLIMALKQRNKAQAAHE